MLLKKMLFYTQDQVDYDNGSILKTDSELLKIVFEALVLKTGDLVGHCKSTRWQHFLFVYL